MLDEAIGYLRGFFRWWGSRLAGCVPGALSRRLFGRGGRLELAFHDDRLGILRIDAEGARLLADLPLDPDAPRAARKAVQAVLRETDWSGFPVFRLDPRKVLESRVELPVEAAANLAEVLAFQMDTYTPFPAEEVLFDYRVAGSDAGLERLQVDLLVAQRSDVERVLAAGAALGLATDRVSGPRPEVGGEAGAGEAFNLLPEPLRARPGRLPGLAAAGLAATAAALAAATLWLWIDRRETELLRAEARVAELRRIAAAAADLDERVQALATAAAEAVAFKRDGPLAVALLDELTRRLPDGTWLTTLEFDRGRLELAGYSDRPATLLEKLEAAPMLANARFSAAVTADLQYGTDRFAIAADVVAPAGGEPR